jgi:KinB signaling pathway activation protein
MRGSGTFMTGGNWLFAIGVGTIMGRLRGCGAWEDNQLTIRKWTYLFWTTLLWGIGAATATGLTLAVTDTQFTFVGASQVGYNLFTGVLGGAIISIVCQMGFFSYLIIRMIALGIIRSKRVWDLLQIFLIVLTLYETASLRYLNFTEGLPLIRYFTLPLVVLVISAAVAIWKVKLTNRNAFIPALFFMIVASILEAVPALKLDHWPSTLFMIVPILCCNAWQILILQKILAEKRVAKPL